MTSAASALSSFNRRNDRFTVRSERSVLFAVVLDFPLTIAHANHELRTQHNRTPSATYAPDKSYFLVHEQFNSVIRTCIGGGAILFISLAICRMTCWDPEEQGASRRRAFPASEQI